MTDETTAPESQDALDEAMLKRLGFERRYYLCKHPAWPDPLLIWPPTAEQARKTFDEHPSPDAYVKVRWEQVLRQSTIFIPPLEESDWTHKTVRVTWDHDQHVAHIEEANGDLWDFEQTVTLVHSLHAGFPTHQKLLFAIDTAYRGWQHRTIEKANGWAVFDLFQVAAPSQEVKQP